MLSQTLPSVETPSSNTGLKCQNPSLYTHVDFLQFVVKLPTTQDFTVLCQDLAIHFDDAFTWALDTPSVHGRRFASSGRSVRGSLAAFNPPSESSNYCDGWVSIPGSVLRLVSVLDLYQFCLTLKALGATITRFDVALGDYDKSISFEQVLEAAQAGNFSGSRYCDPRLPFRRGTSSGSLGWCIYFGSPQSDKRLRFYNKAAESQGELDCYRWEVQFRAKYADEAFKTFLDSEADPLILSGLVSGAVSFVDRTSGDRLSRQGCLPWWQQFLDKIGGFIRLSLPRFKPTIERSKEWINRQVATTLAAIREVYSDYFPVWLNEQIENGFQRLSDRHSAMIRVARKDWLYPPTHTPPAVCPLAVNSP